MKKAIWLVLALGTAVAAGCSASDDGDISLRWAITQNGQASTCAAVNATTVSVTATRSSGSAISPDLFDCDDLSGRTFRLPAGTYTIEIDLLDQGGNRLNLVDVVVTGVVVENGRTTDIGLFEFAFNSGRVTFRVHMGSAAVTGGNCNPTNPGNGAGVALEEISVVRVGTSQCIALDITGVTNASDQPVTESTCDPFLCQLETTLHTINGLQDGQYLMAVFGRKGATSGQSAPVCYVSDEMPFTISGGSTVNLGQIFAPFDTQFDTQNLCNATKP